METYNGQYIRAKDGDTILADVEIGLGQVVTKSIRITGIKSRNMIKKRLSGFTGSGGLEDKFRIELFFIDNGKDIELKIQSKDICGRWFGDIITKDTAKSLKEFILSNYRKSEYWQKENVDDEIQKWYNGETVTIPKGGTLPTFRTWGKDTRKDGNSKLTGGL